MTTPISETGAAPSQPKADSFLDWLHINSRLISIAAGTVAIIAFGYWFVQKMSMNETLNSERQLQVAKQSINSGNAALAEADLKKVVDKYPSKPAGAEAGLLLAQLRMEKGDYQAAATGLQDLASKISSGPNAPGIRSVLGDADSQLNKPAEAAVEYEKAAGLTNLPNEKAFYLTKAGRAYQTAGKTAEAKKVFESVAAQSANPGAAAEAKVRLGELITGGKA